MKKLIAALVLFVSGLAFAQGVRVDGVAQSTAGVFGVQTVIPSPNPVITVCTSGATGIPCSPQVQTFTDSTLGTPCAANNQVTLTGTSVCSSTGDTKGNYGFWVASGNYKYTVTGPGITGQLYNLTVALTPNGPATFSTLTVTGNSTLNPLISSTANPSATGFIRAASTDSIGWRNNANGADILLSKTGAAASGIPADTLDLHNFGADRLADTLFNGPNPYYDIRTFGAKCDGATDDTTAIQACLTAVNAVSSGICAVPVTTSACVVAGQLNMDQFFHVGLTGVPNGGGVNYSDTGGAGRPKLLFTGTTSPLIKARSASALLFKDLEIQYNNAAFVGTVIDTSHVIAADSQGDLFDNVLITGTATANSATALLFIQNSDNFEIRKSSFHNAVNAINAASTNLVSIHDSTFSSLSGDITGTFIVTPGIQMSIGPNNNFEIGNVANTVFDCSSGCQRVISFNNNMLEDTIAGYSGTIFKNIGGGGAGAVNITGNNLLGGASALGTLMSFTGSPELVNFTGNTVSNWATVFNGNCCVGDFTVTGNEFFGTITTFMVGSPTNSGNRGIITDNKGLTTVYGNFQARGNQVTLTADWTCGTGGTVASCVAATIIGSGGGVPLTFTLPLETASYTLECDLVVGQATAATLNQWNLLTATNGAGNVEASYTMATAATAMAVGAVTGVGATTTTFQITPSWTLGGTGTKMPVHIVAQLENVSASGTVASLQLVAPTVADLVTIFRGSGCRIR